MAIRISIVHDEFEAIVEKTTRVWDFYDKYTKDTFLKKVAHAFRAYLIEAISTQEFDYLWPELSKKYYAWKIKWGLPSDFWIQYGLLYRSFVVEDFGNGFSVRLAEGVYPSKHKSIFDTPGSSKSYTSQPISVAEYGYYMEYGRGESYNFGEQHPRPLIRPGLAKFRTTEFKEMLAAHRRYLDRIWSK